MSFDYKAWQERISSRQDITGMLTHLTKPVTYNNEMSEKEINLGAVEILVKILSEGVIKGSETSKGFIIGNRRAVCFQDAPFNGIIQNVQHEVHRRNKGDDSKIRYCGVGLAFSKFYVFERGGRPVIYEETNVAKQFLAEEEHWRIVNCRLRTKLPIIDWTHEREWSCPDKLDIVLPMAHVVLYDKDTYDYFLEKCPLEISNKIHGITILKSILM